MCSRSRSELGEHAVPAASEVPQTSPPASTPAISRLQLLLMALAAMLVLCVTVNPLANVDIWFHLKAGELIARTRQIPTADPFSSIAQGRPWIVNAWLSELILWGTHRLLGPNGLILLTAALVMATYGALLLLWRRLGADLSLGIAVFAAAVLGGAFRFSPRADMLSMLLTAVTLFLLYTMQKNRPVRLALLVPIFLLWPNLHMAFLNGIVILWVFLLGEALAAILAPRSEGWIARPISGAYLRWLAPITALCVLATLANPYGFRAWIYTSLVAGGGVFRKAIEEWSPLMQSGNPVETPFLWALTALMGFYIASIVMTRRVRLTSALLMLFAFGSMLAMRRQALLFTLVSFAALADTWQTRPDAVLTALDAPRIRRLLPAGIAAGLAAVVILIGAFGLGDGLPRDHILRAGVDRLVNPVDTADFVAREMPPGDLFNTMEYGGYLLWRLYPAHRVFIDGRVDMYGEDSFLLYREIAYDGRRWREELDRRKITACVLGYPSSKARLRENLCVRLCRDPEWSLVYWDDISMVFARKVRANAEVIARHGYRYLNPMCLAALNRGVSEGRFPEITAETERLLAEHPRAVTAHTLAAMAFKAIDLPERAAEETRIARRLDTGGYFTSGDQTRVLGAMAGSGKARSLAAEKGLLLSRQGRYQEAIGFLLKAIQREPKSAELHFHLAFAYRQRGKIAEAEREYREAARLSPEKGEIVYDLCCLLATAGRRREAIDCLSTAVKRLPKLTEQAKVDPDLISLHDDPRFAQLTGLHSAQ